MNEPTRWPADEDLPRTARLRAKLALIPDSISGISLIALKDTTLPAWAGEGPAPEDAPDGKIAAALRDARALHARGDADGATELLLSAAREARTRPEWTFFALWLLEVAERWSSGGASERLRCQVRARLGGLAAQVGDVREGTELLRDASRRLFDLADAASDREALMAEAWWWKYEAVAWGLRTGAVRRPEAVVELKGIQDQQTGPDSEAWFHAGLELVAADAGPDKHTANVLKTEQLLRLAGERLPADACGRLTAHAHQVLGAALRFGNNRFLHTRSRDEFKAAVLLYEAARDWPGAAQTLDALGRICSQLGEHADADAALRRSMGLKQHLKDLWGLGASFNGLGDSLIRRGRPLEAVPLIDANLMLLRLNPGASRNLILRNLGHKAEAYMTPYQVPLQAEDHKPLADDLQKAADVLNEYQHLMAGQPDMDGIGAYHQMHRGALARLQARLAEDGSARVALLAAGEESLRACIKGLVAAHRLGPLPNAEIHLAGLLTDRARLTPEGPERVKRLAEAGETLRKAETDIWDTYERAYLELEWAWYYRTLSEGGEEGPRTGARREAEMHLASARHHASACGNESVRQRADARMGVRLRGPTDQDRWDVILPPGEEMVVPVFARDWRDRPLPGYSLHAAVTLHPDAAFPPEVDLACPSAATDSVGCARFTLRAAAGARPGPAVLEVRDDKELREARVQVHVQPFAIEIDADLADGLTLDRDDRVVLRHLFGPRFRRLVVRKQFGGLGGARVLLVEPFLAPPTDPGRAGPAGGDQFQAQHCLVKIGDRRRIADEAACYEKHVKDILSPNTSRMAGWTAWGERAGIRMSLAGDQDWDRALDELDWLVKAPAMDAHHLLDDVFARDLGACWYTNGTGRVTRMRLVEVYGQQMPVLLTVREPNLADGLFRDRPADVKVQIGEGLQPPGPRRGVEPGNKVYLGCLQIADYRQRKAEGEWEYRLVNPTDGLRVAFRTQVPPSYLDADAVADHLIGQSRHVVGIVEELLFDRLAGALRACVESYPRDRPEEQIALSDDGATLTIRTGAEELALPNPLHSLYDFLNLPLAHRRSIIHGDLHTRNVIVSPAGMPFYIDFSETRVGPTLFDFIKHEAALWDWNLAAPPAGAPPCTLADAIRLMRELTSPENRFPAPFARPQSLGEGRGRRTWLAKFYQCVGRLRLLARQYSTAPEEAQDYFGPLCLYAALVLRWTDPRKTESPKEKAAFARRGVFLTVLSGLLLERGLTGVSATPV